MSPPRITTFPRFRLATTVEVYHSNTIWIPQDDKKHKPRLCEEGVERTCGGAIPLQKELSFCDIPIRLCEEGVERMGGGDEAISLQINTIILRSGGDVAVRGSDVRITSTSRRQFNQAVHVIANEVKAVPAEEWKLKGSSRPHPDKIGARPQDDKKKNCLCEEREERMGGYDEAISPLTQNVILRSGGGEIVRGSDVRIPRDQWVPRVPYDCIKR